jgi:lysozyme family protein
MADFLPAFERTLVLEGGYKLHTVANDTGGQTYAGIARNANPRWPGWRHIDRGDTPPTDMVRDFYRAEYWNPIGGDSITSQTVAEAIYDFGVNAGRKTSVKLAQAVVDVTPDGTVGPKTLAAFNAVDPAHFVSLFALVKIRRYADIVNRDRSQQKFLLGWINRTMKGLTT